MTDTVPPKPWTRTARNLAWIVLALIVLLLWADAGLRFGVDWMAVVGIGGGVGWVEILGRYRYAPMRATLTFSAAAYVAINVAAAATAYYLLPLFYAQPAGTPDKKAAVENVLIAGFGALVFLRSSLFKIRVGDADVGVGPAALLDTLLLVADRGVDRREAVSRAQDVSALVVKVKDPRLVAKMLTKYCLALMQNVDDKTKKAINDAISDIIADSEIPDSILIDLVALQLGVVVGPDVLQAAIVALGDRLATTPSPPNPAPNPPSPTAAHLGIAADIAAPETNVVSKAELEAELKAAKAAAPTPDPPKTEEPPASHD